MIKMSNSKTLNQLPKCKCGNTIFSENVKVKNNYSLFGWFMWSQGSSVVPKKMKFKCLRCESYFCELTNKELIKEYMQLNPY